MSAVAPSGKLIVLGGTLGIQEVYPALWLLIPVRDIRQVLVPVRVSVDGSHVYEPSAGPIHRRNMVALRAIDLDSRGFPPTMGQRRPGILRDSSAVLPVEADVPCSPCAVSHAGTVIAGASRGCVQPPRGTALIGHCTPTSGRSSRIATRRPPHPWARTCSRVAKVDTRSPASCVPFGARVRACCVPPQIPSTVDVTLVHLR